MLRHLLQHHYHHHLAVNFRRVISLFLFWIHSTKKKLVLGAELSPSYLYANKQNTKKVGKPVLVCFYISITSWKWQFSFPSHPPPSPKPFSTFLLLIKEAPGCLLACQGRWGSVHKPVITIQRDIHSLVWRQSEDLGRALNIGNMQISFQCTLPMSAFLRKAGMYVCKILQICDVTRF